MLKDLKVLLNLMAVYLRGKTISIIVGFITALLFSLVGLATPYMTKFLIDTVFHAQREDLLLQLLILSGLILIIMTFTGIISDYILIKSFEKAKLLMRYDLFKRLQRAPINFLSGQRSGELNYRLFGDTETIEGFWSKVLINVPIDLLFTVIIGVIMVTWHLEIAIFVFVVLILQVFVILGFRKPLLNLAMLQKSKSQQLSGFAVEKFRNIQLITTLNAEEMESNNFKRNLNELMNVNIKSFMLSRVTGLAVTLINNIWSFGILWFGGGLVLSGQITLGTLMAFLLISGMLYPRIASLASAVLSFQDIRASLYRFFEYYNVTPLVSDSPNAECLSIQQGEVVFNKVKFYYKPEHLVLKGINAKFKPRTITAIVGSSGAGKSTLARLLIRLYDPLEGSILIDGTDIRNVKLNSLRENIGYAVQGEYLFSGTIWDNICYGIDSPTEEEVFAAVKKACAYEFIMELPDKFQTFVGEGGLNLSGGEAQRIALARLFLKNYKITLLDEPTSFLDNKTEADIQKAILTLKETTTVIVIAHRLSTVIIADNILVMEDGMVVEEGKHDELLCKNGIYAELYNKYFEEVSCSNRFFKNVLSPESG